MPAPIRRRHPIEIIALQLLDRAVRARLVDNAGQLVREHLQRVANRYPEMLSDLVELVAVERGANLLGSHLDILAVAQPGFDLISQSALLQLIHQTLQTPEISLCKERRK